MASDFVIVGGKQKEVLYKCPRGPDHDGPCYEPQISVLTTLTVAKAKWSVVVGAGIVATTPDTDATFVITIVDSPAASNVTIDSVILKKVTVTAVGVNELLLYMPRRMLVPPGGQVQTNLGSQLGLEVMVCGSLEDAIQAL